MEAIYIILRSIISSSTLLNSQFQYNSKSANICNACVLNRRRYWEHRESMLRRRNGSARSKSPVPLLALRCRPSQHSVDTMLKYRNSSRNCFRSCLRIVYNLGNLQIFYFIKFVIIFIVVIIILIIVLSLIQVYSRQLDA